VPANAVTLTIPTLLDARLFSLIIPEARKADA